MNNRMPLEIVYILVEIYLFAKSLTSESTTPKERRKNFISIITSKSGPVIDTSVLENFWSLIAQKITHLNRSVDEEEPSEVSSGSS